MKYGSIAGGENSTVWAACQTLENGGNAFDAAVAAVFTSMVSEFNLTGLGGGGAFLACPAGLEPTLFDFFVDLLGRLSGVGFLAGQAFIENDAKGIEG